MGWPSQLPSFKSSRVKICRTGKHAVLGFNAIYFVHFGGLSLGYMQFAFGSPLIRPDKQLIYFEIFQLMKACKLGTSTSWRMTSAVIGRCAGYGATIARLQTPLCLLSTAATRSDWPKLGKNST